jgi:hypothetical protein
MKLLTGGALSILATAACNRSEPVLTVLPKVAGVNYQVMVRTYQDGAYADQPFHLMVKADGSTDLPKIVFRSAQCQHVLVAQTPRTLYVFYKELVLNNFASSQDEVGEPRVLLCDLHTPECAAAQRELSKRGANFSHVCTYKM